MKHSLCNIPDIIIHNACVHLVDDENSTEQAIAVSDGKILAVGNNSEILSLAGEDTKIINADGASVIPGINDSHCHMWEAGMLMEGIITFGIPSIKELAELVGEYTKKMQPGQWLQGGSWIESQFVEGRMPTKYDLDPYSPENPVVLERIFSTCCANSAALKAAGITKETPDPKGGTIGRDENGEPNGLLFRSAKQLVRDVMPSAFGDSKFGSGEQITLAIRRAQDEFLRYGITSIMEAGVTPSMIRAYQRIRNNGELKLRVNLMPCWHGFAINEDEDFSDRLIGELGLSSGFGDEWLRIGNLKMAIDGGLTSKTSLRTWNYVGDDNIEEFPLRLDLNELDGWVKEAHDNDWGVGIHVMGDVAVKKAAEAIYSAYKENPADRRHQLIHCYYADEDVLKMMAEADIIMAAQPAFIYNEADGYPKLLHEEQQRTFMPLRSAIDAGVNISMSTDIPSAHHNPFWGMYSAVTRKGMHGHCLGKEEAITMQEALRAMTKGGAYMSKEENIKGSLLPGMLADMVILDRNLNNTHEEDIRNVVVEMTIVDGKIAYERS
ncbi:MAG: amidohydrolase [Anaerofustis stercorihominis]|nr:amidohydrolase [Anaerofustis stercorihominis]